MRRSSLASSCAMRDIQKRRKRHRDRSDSSNSGVCARLPRAPLAFATKNGDSYPAATPPGRGEADLRGLIRATVRLRDPHLSHVRETELDDRRVSGVLSMPESRGLPEHEPR